MDLTTFSTIPKLYFQSWSTTTYMEYLSHISQIFDFEIAAFSLQPISKSRGRVRKGLVTNSCICHIFRWSEICYFIFISPLSLGVKSSDSQLIFPKESTCYFIRLCNSRPNLLIGWYFQHFETYPINGAKHNGLSHLPIRSHFPNALTNQKDILLRSHFWSSFPWALHFSSPGDLLLSTSPNLIISCAVPFLGLSIFTK